MGKDEAIIFRIVIPNKGRPAAPVLRDHIAGIDLGQVFTVISPSVRSSGTDVRMSLPERVGSRPSSVATQEMVPPVVKRGFFHFDVGQDTPAF